MKWLIPKMEKQTSIGTSVGRLKAQVVGGSLLLLLWVLFLAGSVGVASPLIQRITIGTFFPYYTPTVVHVAVGTSISWENPTSDIHSITHDGCRASAEEVCAFDSGPIGPHQTFTLEHLPPGKYGYHCSFHPIMRGVLVIEEGILPNET